MNLQEAIRTGRPFRRNGCYWYRATSEGAVVIDSIDPEYNKDVFSQLIFSVEDLLATDWEIHETEITHTRSSLARVLHNVTWKEYRESTVAQDYSDVYVRSLGSEAIEAILHRIFGDGEKTNG